MSVVMVQWLLFIQITKILKRFYSISAFRVSISCYAHLSKFLIFTIILLASGYVFLELNLDVIF